MVKSIFNTNIQIHTIQIYNVVKVNEAKEVFQRISKSKATSICHSVNYFNVLINDKRRLYMQ